MRKTGFTLIELMITVAIVAVIAAVAYPSYLSSVVRANRGDAQTVLMDIAQRQQEYLLNMRDYAPDLATLNVTVPPNVSERYTITFATASGPPPTFTITATPISGKSQEDDGALSIDQQGTKSPADKW